MKIQLGISKPYIFARFVVLLTISFFIAISKINFFIAGNFAFPDKSSFFNSSCIVEGYTFWITTSREDWCLSFSPLLLYSSFVSTITILILSLIIFLLILIIGERFRFPNLYSSKFFSSLLKSFWDLLTILILSSAIYWKSFFFFFPSFSVSKLDGINDIVISSFRYFFTSSKNDSNTPIFEL